MISFKHHAIYWVFSVLTIPVTNIRKLLLGRGLFPNWVDDLDFATACLTLYVLVHIVVTEFQDVGRRARGPETTFSGNIEAIELEKLIENSVENAITKEVESRNGKAKGAKINKGRKKSATGANGKPRAVHFEKESTPPNGNAKMLSNENRTLQNLTVAQRLRKKSPERYTQTQKALFSFLCEYHDALYYLSLALLFTRTDLVPGFGEGAENAYVHEGPGPWASTLMGFCGLVVMGILMECSLYIKLQYWPWWPWVWFADGLTASEIFIRVWLLVPLIDVAETVLYAIASKTRIEWYMKRLELIQRPL
ncbi:hypothetical protein FBEOM_9851 [Fusarium beomiforme]|uniref:Uncharacterized protein n=1 Tax=Fusarium beomiforme TaxID=44412 RepID=A0A9P5DVH6_9HYPO|nr:hypothetical protein FBEOM_9851 [Fusarium beomiforme]